MKEIKIIFIISFLSLLTISNLLSQNKGRAFLFGINSITGGVDFVPLEGKIVGLQAFTGPTLGIAWWDDKNRYVMLEVSGYSFEENFQRFKNEYVLASIRYEKGAILPLFSPDSHFRFRLGVSPRLSYVNYKFIPLTLTEFQESNKLIFVTISAVSHFEYWAGENIFFHLSPSLSGYAFGADFGETKKPSLTEQKRKRNGFFLDYGCVLFRIGAGFKF